MMHCVLVVRPAIQADRWDNATDTNRSFHSSLHENTDNNACKMWHDLISSLPFSKVSSSFLWIGLCAATVLGTTRGTVLSGRAACFWNNELDKKPNNSVFDSLTAKTLPLDRGHPHAAAVCLLETKGIEAIVGNSSQRRSVKANGNMTPRVKRYYFLYFSPPRHCSDVPGHFATRRSIICRGRPHLVYVVTGEAAFLWHGTARYGLNRHIPSRRCMADKREGAGKSKCRGTEPFKFITRYAKITVEHRVLLSCFVFVFLHVICELFSLPCVVIKASCSPSQAPGREEARSTLGVMFWNTISRDVNLIWTQKGTEALTLLFFTKENCCNAHISGQCLHSHSDWRRKMYRFLKLARLSFNPSSHRCLMKVPPMFILP